VNILRERPSQRLHHRVAAPLRVYIAGHAFNAVDWSLGGFRLADPDFDHGIEYPVLCTLPFQGFDITFEAQAAVVWNSRGNRQAGFRFHQLGDRETALMQHFVEDLVRGKMTDVQDTILRIDTPVTPVPTTPDPNPIQVVPVRRWPIKQIMMTFFYLLLGMAVFGYVGVFAYASLFRLEVSSAVVSAERARLNAPVSGQVVSLPHAVGATIAAGSAIAHIRNDTLEKEVGKAELSLMQAKAELSEHKGYLAAEAEREQGYRLVAENKLRKARAELRKLQTAVETSKDRLARYEELFARGYLKKDILSDAQLAQADAAAALEQQILTLAELKELQQNEGAALLYAGSGFAGAKSERIAEVARWQEEVDFRTRLLAELRQKHSETALLAPFDGHIADIAVHPGATLQQGDLILILEEAGMRKITAFLTQEEIQHVRKGSEAKVFVPGENRWIQANVEQVSRTDGFVDEVTETHRFRAPGARSAKVVLSSRNEILPTAGSPVTVYFERQRVNLVFRTVSGFLRGTE